MNENALALSFGQQEFVNPDMYTSITPDSDEKKEILYNAMTNPTHRLGEMVNQRIAVQDVFVERIDMVNSETGELVKTPRVILIDENGESYSCVSTGIFNALTKLSMIYGAPPWNPALEVTPLVLKKEKRNILTLKKV